MRQFVVISHDVSPTADISLADLPGAGRLDVLCRALNSALFLSHDIRDDVRVHLIVADTYTLRFDGATLRGLHPDERSIAARIDAALDVAEDAIGHQPVEASPGVSVYRMDTAATLSMLADTQPVYWLTATGTPLPDVSIPSDAAFVLSDHRDFTAADTAVLEDTATERLTVGPRSVHGHHAITIVNNFLDTAGYTEYS